MIPSTLIMFALSAQSVSGPVFEQRGFLENQGLFYPQDTPNDPANLVDQALLRWEASIRPSSWFKLAGSFDARADTHKQVDREGAVSLDDRRIQRPALAMRQLSVTLHKGIVTAEIGRQFIRWGKTDILTPTDRFAPRDYLSSVVDSNFLGVVAGRVTISGANDSLDLVWQPWFTPSRTPLLNQRWTVLPPEAGGINIVDAGARYPGGPQFGARWNHIAAGYEYSLSYFRGFNTLPLFDGRLDPTALTLRVQRFYPNMRMYGGDAAVQLRWVTIKGEGGYFTTTTPNTQEYVLYVVQLERQLREWSFVGGYAGSILTNGPENVAQFAPDRGFAKSFVGRAALTIDVNRSLAVETAIRAEGSFVRFEYSQTFGEHWRVTPGVAWIRGEKADFLGQYRLNSYASLAVRYSF
jgi:hypothetical protein